MRTMNTDLKALTVAVHNVAITRNNNNNNSHEISSGGSGKKTEPTTPRKMRRRTSHNGDAAKKFVEAAHQSWTFSMEDLPEASGALQKRRSTRSTMTLSNSTLESFSGSGDSTSNNNNNTIVVVEPLAPPAADKMGISSRTASTMESSARTVSSRGFHHNTNGFSERSGERSMDRSSRRRASHSGSSVSIVANNNTNNNPAAMMEDSSSPRYHRSGSRTKSSTGGKLKRRSSLHHASVAANASSNSGKTKGSADKGMSSSSRRSTARRVERVGSDPSPKPTGRPRVKMTRRNTIGSVSVDEVAPLVQVDVTPKQQLRSSLGGSNTSNSKLSRRRSSNKKSSSSNGSGSSNGKGSVRFELDHKNRIKRRVHYMQSQAARKHPSALWWSEDDLERIFERENKVYEKFSNDRKYKKCIRQIWGSCSKAAKVPLGTDAITHVSGAACRGLEVDILETARDRRSRVIKSVLDAQESLLDFDSGLRCTLLGARYKNLCRSSVRFARKLAEGDELEVANVYSSN